jgi:hypothetical protein
MKMEAGREFMVTFVDFVEELAMQEITLDPAEVQRMVERYGKRTLQMGNLQQDGSLCVPVDCIIEAVQSLGNKTLAEAVAALRSEQFVPMLESVESLMERVSEARKRKVLALATAVQEAPSDEEAREHWRQLEHTIFGI